MLAAVVAVVVGLIIRDLEHTFLAAVAVLAVDVGGMAIELAQLILVGLVAQ